MASLELIIIAVGLSMDAFAVAVCKGLSLRAANVKSCVKVGLYFGIFQGMMPLIGYIAGSWFADSITSVDHWIAFVLLVFIGARMVKSSFGKEDQDNCCQGQTGMGPSVLSFREMLALSLATSVDALAVGVSFAFLNVSIVPAVSSIGAVTFLLSAAGVKIGNVFGLKFKSKAELAGGVILILMGLKIVLEHTGMIG